MKKRKILVVEDEPDLLEVMEYNLSREGFRILSARDGRGGLLKAQQDLPDLVILDLMLPGMDGLEVCRRIRGDELTRSIPIIMVTAKGEESDVVLGLGVGADDYVTKPFSPRELIARVHTVLRRAPMREDQDVKERIEFPGLVIDSGRHDVKVEGRSVGFTATELRLLHFFACHPGRVFSRDQLVSRVIGEHAVVIERNIDVHVRSIRRKLGPHKDLIETVRGVGYRFREASA